MAEPRGAGRGGGLLFVLVLLFVGYLAVSAVAGVLRLVLSGLIILVCLALAARVLGRR